MAKDTTARILHTLLLGIAAWIIFLVTVDLPTTTKPSANLAMEIFLSLTVLGALRLLHKGRFRAASMIYLCGSWLVFTVLIIFNGGIHSPAAFFYLAISISAAWLLGYGAALVTAAVCLASSGTMAVLEAQGFPMPLYFPGTPFGTFNALVGAMVISAVPVARVLQILKEALARSRKAEAAVRQHLDSLRESEERFRRVFEEGPLGLALVGKDYRFLKVNEALCGMVGYSVAELLQLSFADITYPYDLEANMESAAKLFRGEIPFYQMQKRYVKKNGEIIWVNLISSVIRDREGEPLYGLAMIENVTEVKRSREEALARQKLESLGVLASGIAHDFNNLLSGILANMELLRAELDENAPAQEIVRSIDACAVRAAEVVRQLMIYAGQESAVLEQVDLASLVREMLQLMRASIAKNAAFKVELPENVFFIRANLPQIRQVILNLITNASEALGGKDGVIAVTLTHVQPKQDSLGGLPTSLHPGDFLRLEVSDTGCGMTQEMLARIFDPFFSTKSSGRGLGLCAVQGIIRGHGGAIHVESAPGRGSRFEVQLPCMVQTEPDSDIPKPASTRDDGNLPTVLLIDDEDTLRLAMAKLLRARGFDVFEAAEGRTGIDLLRARASQVDVVLLDVTLASMPSREVLLELRKIRPGVKVIVTTAYGRDHALAAVDAEKSCPYIRKPFQVSELTGLILKTCQDKATFAATE